MSETREAATVIKAEEPSPEFRSIWTDLRGVSFEQGFFDVKGTRMRYLRSGPRDAPKIIMLPGTGGHAETFVANIGPLGEAFDVWAIDVPGSGYSDKHGKCFDAIHTAKFVKDWADLVGAAQIDVIGCSVGSWTALQVAHLYPKLVKHLILVSAAGAPMPEPGDPNYEFYTRRDMGVGMNDDRRDNAKSPTWAGSEKILRSLMPDPRRLPDDMIAARLDVNRQPGAADAYEKVNWWMDYDLRMSNTLTKQQLREMKTPVLAVSELKDLNKIMVEAMVEALPNARSVVVDGVGHWAHYEAPDQFNAMAMEFLTDKAG